MWTSFELGGVMSFFHLRSSCLITVQIRNVLLPLFYVRPYPMFEQHNCHFCKFWKILLNVRSTGYTICTCQTVFQIFLLDCTSYCSCIFYCLTSQWPLHCRCRDYSDDSSAGAHGYPHWQRRRLRRALHQQPGSTTFVQNAASVLERQVPFSFVQTLLCVMLGTSFSFSIASMTIIHRNVTHCIRWTATVLAGMKEPAHCFLS